LKNRVQGVPNGGAVKAAEIAAFRQGGNQYPIRVEKLQEYQMSSGTGEALAK